ncbi:MAG TPA: hypothetical protein VMY35_19910, partial [Phycisphaerae bacterium]|nr:hypothetical protein [Phycisphaerae bacterium]
SASTITLPPATCTLSGIGLAETFSAVKTFTAAPVVMLDDETDGIVNGLTLTHSSSNNAATFADGSGISFKLENNANTVEEWASIDVASQVIDDGTEGGSLQFNLMNYGTVGRAMLLSTDDQSLTLGRNYTDGNGIDKLRIYGLTENKGSLVIQSVANTGNTDITIKNAAHAQATTYTLQDCGNSTADIVTTYGEFTLNGDIQFAGNVTHNDDMYSYYGTDGDSLIKWETGDTNAQALIFALGAPAGNVVPVAAFGDIGTILGRDLGFFNGVTQPTLALLDAAATSYLKIDWSAATAARITVGGIAASLTLGDATVPVTFGGMPRIPTATVAAAGDAQANAAAITTGFTLVSAADAAKGVKLPAAVAGAVCIIKNGAAAVLKVWPNTDDAINAVAANANDVLAASTAAMYVAYDATTWYTIPLLGS